MPEEVLAGLDECIVRVEVMPYRTLSPREIQVLNLVKLGYEDKRVGAELGMAVQTAKNHMQMILAKLQAVNRVDAVVKALRAGYISLDGENKRIARRLENG